MRDSTDRTKVQDKANDQVSDLNALTVGNLAVPATVATQRTMMAFPTMDLDQRPMSTLLLSEEPMTKADKQALRAMFKQSKAVGGANAKT